MTYQYSYLIGDLVLLVFWSILFYLRKDVRKEMLAISLIFFVSLYILKLNTFYSAIISFLILIFFIWFKRKDLILNSLISGILLVIISVPAYLIPEFITPGWIQASWYFENLSGITFFKVPIEDFIWIFLTGAFIGPLYEFYKEAKVVSLTKKG